jgi:hypothetical protein
LCYVKNHKRNSEADMRLWLPRSRGFSAIARVEVRRQLVDIR